MTLRPFIVCIHDATPAFDHETRVMIRDLSPLLGRRFCFGVVPDWHDSWPLAAHPDYCRLIRDGAEELLLHGYSHRRSRGWGAVTLLTQHSDEMNGLDRDETRRTLARGQRVFADAFGAPARGFVAPAWQQGHVRPTGRHAHGHHLDAQSQSQSQPRSQSQPQSQSTSRRQPDSWPELASPSADLELDYVLGFFSLQASDGRNVPLATWSWDCGRWGWLGHVGHGLGALQHSLDRGVTMVAIHPSDLTRGFWPKILRLLRELLRAGYRPSTVAGLLDAGLVEPTSIEVRQC